MLQQDNGNDKPWCTVVDFNFVTTREEIMGKGVPYNMKKSFEFISIIEACGPIDLGLSGLKFTWCNKRGIAQRIWQRLDSDLVNDIWPESMLQTTGSHHCPLLIKMISKDTDYINYFKFLIAGLVVLIL